MSQKKSSWFALVLLAIAVASFMQPATARAGANAWTGGRPSGASDNGRPIVAADPHDPFLVYAAYGPDLYRSPDGGRGWTRIASFESIQSLLLHPASPSTLYVGAGDSVSGGFVVFKSADGGATWSRTGFGSDEPVTALAGSPTDSSRLFAGGAYGSFYKTTDGGEHWSSGASLEQVIATLVLDTEGRIYAGTEADYDYCGFFGDCSGHLKRSTDGGTTVSDVSPGTADVRAILVDSDYPSIMFVGLTNRTLLTAGIRGVYRTFDAGVSWTRASDGIPDDANVSSLAKNHPDGTFYAGTDVGVYRSRDFGETWVPLGQQLHGADVRSLALSGGGRVLQAATDRGLFTLESGTGPVDISSGAGGRSRVLSWEGDRLSVRTLDESGSWTSTPFEGPFSGWTATAIAEGADGRSRVLWQNGDGRVGLEIVGPSGSEAAFRFAPVPGFTAADVFVGNDGTARLLWIGARGEMFLASVDASGAQALEPEYGPYAGWPAVAIAGGAGDATWVLWRSMDGRASVSRHQAGVMDQVFRFDPKPGLAVEDIAVGADGLPRILWRKPEESMEIWTVAGDGRLTAGQAYEKPGFRALRISAGADGLTRVLWNHIVGAGEVWLLNPDNTLRSQHVTPAGLRGPTQE